MKFKTILITFLIFVCAQVSYAVDYFKTGVAAYNSGQYKQAMYYLYNAAAQYPTNVNVRYWYCLALVKNGEIEAAKANYKKIISQSPNSQEAKYSRLGLQSIDAKVSSDSSLAYKYQEEDYLKNMYRNGVLYKWPPSSIKVYVEPGASQALTKKAFDEWEKKTSQVVTFIFVENPAYAKIKVSFVDKLNKDTFDKTFQAGNCSYTFAGNYMAGATIKILTVSPNGQRLTDTVLYGTLLHEIGHSIGLLGHSTNPSDVMATATKNTVTCLSQRDINTAIRLYKSYKNYDKAALDSAKVNEHQDFANKVPSNPQSWIDLGNSYYQAKQYQKAVDSYQKAVELKSNDVNLFINLSAAYYNLKQDSESISAIKKALEIEPSNSKAMGNLLIIYNKNAQYDLAKASLSAYLKANPTKRNDKSISSFVNYYKL